jgi:hypothetical protein
MGVALLALFVALGGTGYAMSTVPDNSVGTAQLKKEAVTTPKIANHAVTKSKINTSGLTVPFAASAGNANTARSATNATNATNATSASNATHADNADNAANAATLDGHLASDFAPNCGRGAVLAIGTVPAASTFSSTATPVTAYSCMGLAVNAWRVGTGDYRVAFCGFAFGLAVGADNSFDDFIGIGLVPDEGGAVTLCDGAGAEEFKVTTRGAGGGAADRPFTIVLV